MRDKGRKTESEKKKKEREEDIQIILHIPRKSKWNIHYKNLFESSNTFHQISST